MSNADAKEIGSEVAKMVNHVQVKDEEGAIVFEQAFDPAVTEVGQGQAFAMLMMVLLLLLFLFFYFLLLLLPLLL